MKYKIGDKVRVRKDLEEGRYGGVSFVALMKRYKGKVCTINRDCYGFYVLLEDRNFYWSDEMLEPVGKSAILDDVEFNYLWNIIKPFKEKVKWIVKFIMYHNNRCFIEINLGTESITLPCFPKDSTMYKGMEVDKPYTLEELGFVEAKPKLNCRAVCVDNGKSNDWLTIGKIYEFKDGSITYNNGNKSYIYNSINHFNNCNLGLKLLEIAD